MIKNEIELSYVDHMGDDLMVVNAARQSFSKQKEEFDPVSDGALIHYLATGKTTKDWNLFLEQVINTTDIDELKKMLISYKNEAQHWAPFAHPVVQIRMTIPISLARQIVKHHVGIVWSEESRRYIDTPPEYYIPPVFHSRPEGSVKQGRGMPMEGKDHETVLQAFVLNTNRADMEYAQLIDSSNLSPEEARNVLPQNMMINATLTGSLAAWARVYNQRSYGGAQLIANEFAEKLGNIVSPLFPVSWEALTQ